MFLARAWLESVPGPVVLLLVLPLGALLLWYGVSRSGGQLRREMREDPTSAPTGRLLGALPIPVLRALYLALGLGLIAYGVGRVT